MAQPQARDITLEDLWAGIAWLFESDTTEMAGRHHASISKFIRTLSPDFKVGAVHDFRSTGARTDADLIRAGYLLGNRRLDPIRLNNENPIVTSQAFFQKTTGDRKKIIDLYDSKGFINNTYVDDVVEDIADMSKRNFQTTNDFLRGQQAVGEASTTVYHHQMPDGTETNIKFSASLMSFGAWRFVAPSSRRIDASGNVIVEQLFRNHVVIGSNQYAHTAYTEFTRVFFPKTQDWQKLGARRPGVITFVPFDWSQSWDGLRTLCRTSSSINESYTPNSAFSRTGMNKISGYNTDSTYSNLGEYFLDLSIENPMRTFLESTGDVYRHIRNATAGLPYKANIQMQDLIEINLIKQVTLSTGSPALQQMLDAFLVYALDGTGSNRSLGRKILERRLWSRDAHPRGVIYSRQDDNLFPFILPPNIDATDLPSIISSTNVFLHDIGLSGVDLHKTLSLTPSMMRTLYVNYVDAFGVVYDHAITLPNEVFDLSRDLPCLGVNTLSPSVQATLSVGDTSTWLPGFRYYKELYTDNSRSLSYAWSASSSVSAVNGREEFSTNFSGFDKIGLTGIPALALVSEAGATLPTSVNEPNVVDPLGNPSGTAAAHFTVLDDMVVKIVIGTPSAGVASLTASPNVRFRQIPSKLPLWTAEADATGGALPDHYIDEVAFAAPTKFGIDALGVISAAARYTGDEAVGYITRKPSYAFICQDVFDRDHQILSLMYHDMKGQRFVGPYSYAAFYNYAGELMSTLGYNLSLVGSGERVQGTAVATESPSEVVSGDDTNEATAEDVMEDSD